MLDHVMRILSVLMVVVLGSTLAAADPPKVKISTRMKTVEITDDALGIVAFRMQIPEDWKFEGVMLRDPRCDVLPSVAYRITSPDGLAGFQSLPTFAWHWSDDPKNLDGYRKFHCKLMEPMTATDFLNYVLPAIRPNPTAGKIEPTSDAAQIDALIASYNDHAQRGAFASSEEGGGVHSRIEYTLHGQQIEENLRVVVTTFKNQTAYPHQPVRHQSSSTADVSGMRAPKGQLDVVMKTLYPVFGKADYTDEWKKRMSQKIAADGARMMAIIKKQGDQITDTLRRNHEAYMKQSKASFEKSQQIDRDRQDAMHRSAVAWTLYAGDQQLVRNPTSGETSRVTNQAGTNGYQDQSSGDIVMSTNPNFDPNFYIRGTWTQLENVDPMKP